MPHVEILAEGEREHGDFDEASGELGDEFAAQQIGVGASDEDGAVAGFTIGVDERLEVGDVLDFVDEEILEGLVGDACVDGLGELLRFFDGEEAAFVEVEVEDVLVGDATFAELVHDGAQEAGLTAASDAGDDLDEVAVVEGAQLAQVGLAFVDALHRWFLKWVTTSEIETAHYSAAWGILPVKAHKLTFFATYAP